MSDLVPPYADDPSGRFNLVERQIAGALMLVLPAHDAAEIVRTVRNDTTIDSRLDLARAVVAPTLSRFRWLRWKYRLQRRAALDPHLTPLGPQSGQSGKAAIALALRTGTGLDQDELSDVLATSPTNIARMLVRARVSAIGDVEPCRRAPSELLGLYNEETLELTERLHLREHLRTCEKCAELASRFEALDADMRSHASSASLDEQALDENTGDQPTPGKRDWAMPLLVSVIAITLFLGLGGLLIGVDRVLGGPTPPVPLVPANEESDSALHGWLVSSTTDGLAALNLRTGERRSLIKQASDSNQPPVIMLSPSGDKVALWRFHQDHRITTSVDIVGIDGTTLQTWRWDRNTSPGQISAWLTDDELLFIRVPVQGVEEATEDYLDRMTVDNELLALDVQSGARRAVFTGSIVAAVPSPDLKFMAILGAYNRYTASLPGRTLEIRPVEDGQLGDAVAVEDERFPLQNVRPIWAADSSGVYFPRLSDDSMGTFSDTHRDERIDIAHVTVDGDSTIVVENHDRKRIRLLGVSPELDTMLYLIANRGTGDVTWNLHRVSLADGEDDVLASSIAYPFFFSASATWLPDGKTAIVNDSQMHYIHGDRQTRSVKAGATRYLSIGEDRPVESIATELGLWGVDAWGETTLRWFPEEWLESDEGQTRVVTGIFSEPEPVGEPGNLRHTSAISSVSPGGEYALFEHTSIGVPIVWSTTAASGRLLAGSTEPTDITWSPGNAALVGVQNDPEDGHEMTLFASRTTRVANFFDYRGADPAGLGNDPDRVYAQPTFSSDGNFLFYFVTDRENGHIELWISDYANGHRSVLDWSLPDDARIEPPLIATWTSRETLLVAVPAEWTDGYPTEIDLVRIDLSLGADDDAIDTIYTYSRRGGDRGTTLESIDLSPGQDLVAIRQRSFGSRDPEREVRDAVIVAPTSDLEQAITIARGAAGQGLSWAPNGDWLSYGLDSRVVVSRHDGTEMRALSDPDEMGRFPLWLPGGDLYYTEGDEQSPRLMRVSTR